MASALRQHKLTVGSPRLSFSLEPVSIDTAQAGAEVLKQAWQPPCLHYTPEFVRFQAGYPSAAPSFAVLASDDKPKRFVAAMGRDSNIGPILLSSFYSLVPGCAGSAAVGIIRRELAEIIRAGIPSLVFAAAGSVGEALVAASEAIARPQRPLQQCRIHMALSRSMPAGCEVYDIPGLEATVCGGTAEA